MTEHTLLFWQNIFSNNMVLVTFFGSLLVVMESKGVRTSLKSGLKYALALFSLAILSWLVTIILSYFQFIFLWIFLLLALLACYILNKCGELEGDFFNLPRQIIALAPFVGIQWLTYEQGLNYGEMMVMATASSVGFYLVFILIATIKEKMLLAETAPIFKKTPTLLLAMGILALAFLGFAFM